MVLNRNVPRKPVVFGRKKPSVGKAGGNGQDKGDLQDDDTLDMLLHYAKQGMEHAELSLIQTPDLFSPEEREAFEQNKNMLEQAPFLIETYKSKMSEYDALHKRMIGILRKCEQIVTAGDDQAKTEIKEVLSEAKIFSYSSDGNLVLKDGTAEKGSA